jgi:hypothetical protein
MERFINGFLDHQSIWFCLVLEKTHAFIWRYGFINVHYWTTVCRLHWCIAYHMYNNMRYSLVSDNPWFYIALTTMVLGTQLF